MLPLLLILLISPALGENCSYIFDGQAFTRSSALTIKGLPTNLVLNPQNKDLLFTLIDLDTLQNDDVQTRMDQYVLRQGEPIKIDNINGQAAAVDANNGRVYIASDNGLNVLNEADKASFYSLKDEDIVQIFKPTHDDKLYAVIYPDNEVYVIDLVSHEKKKVDNVPCAYILAVDKNDNVFYECDSKYVKMLLKGFQEPIEFVGVPKNSARAIAVDSFARVMLATNDGIYHLKPDTVIPSKVMDLDFVPSGLVFDGDNFYISTNSIIFKYSSEACN